MITKQLKSNKQFLTNTDNSSLDFKISGCKDSIFFLTVSKLSVTVSPILINRNQACLSLVVPFG